MIQDAAAYRALFGSEPVSVDFKKQTLIVVGHGDAPPFVSVQVTSVADRGRERLVRYTVIGAGAAPGLELAPPIAGLLANPIHVVRVVKRDVPYVFERSFERELTGTISVSDRGTVRLDDRVITEEPFRSLLLPLAGQTVSLKGRVQDLAGTPIDVVALHGTRNGVPVHVIGATKDGKRLRIDLGDATGYVPASEVRLGTPPPAAAPGDLASVTSYTIVEGDTLAAVAARRHVPLAELVAANPQIADPDLVRVGDVVRVPALDRGVVVPGDNLTALSDRHGVPLVDLLAWNPQVANPDLVRPGDFLRLPVTIWKIAAGDTLSALAERFQVALDALLRANPWIEDADRIEAGDPLLVPKPSRTPGFTGTLGHD